MSEVMNCAVVERGIEGRRLTYIFLTAVPRIGELLWFDEVVGGAAAWRVVDVIHSVGAGSYEQSIILYVESGVAPED